MPKFHQAILTGLFPNTAHGPGQFKDSKAFYIAGLVVLLLAVGMTRCFAQSCSTEVVRRNRAAVVFIKVRKISKTTGEVREQRGTGFVVSSSGYLLTAYHIVGTDDQTDEVEITGSLGSSHATSSRLVVIDHNNSDLALLRFADPSRPYPTLNSANVRDIAAVEIGTQLCVMSFPTTRDFVVASGIKTGEAGGFWQTDIPSYPGNSGAPVFLPSGQVVATEIAGLENAQSKTQLAPLSLAQNLLNLVPDLGLSQNGNVFSSGQFTVPPCGSGCTSNECAAGGPTCVTLFVSLPSNAEIRRMQCFTTAGNPNDASSPYEVACGEDVAWSMFDRPAIRETPTGKTAETVYHNRSHDRARRVEFRVTIQ